jgi:integral membrane protein (TIGR01906 family)
MLSLGAAATALFLIAVPVFLVTTNVRVAFNSVGLYTYGFDKYRIAEVTGIPDPELRRVAEELVAYFNGDTEPLDISVSGQALYNQQEITHMGDVKGLVRGVYWAQRGAWAVLAAFAVGGLALRRRAFIPGLLRGLRTGGALTLALLLVAGLAVAAAFRWLFYLFHVISFRNSLWQLDPRTDNLLRMFPEGFWFDATMMIAVATVAEALLLTGASWLALRYMARREGTVRRPRRRRAAPTKRRT